MPGLIGFVRIVHIIEVCFNARNSGEMFCENAFSLGSKEDNLFIKKFQLIYGQHPVCMQMKM